MGSWHEYGRAASDCPAVNTASSQLAECKSTHLQDVIHMTTVPTAVRSGSAPPAAVSVPCRTFSWCSSTAPGHLTHQSTSVHLPDGTDRLVYAETDPDTGGLLYGPVLGGGPADEPVAAGRVLAAELRAAAARIELLVARVELTGGAV